MTCQPLLPDLPKTSSYQFRQLAIPPLWSETNRRVETALTGVPSLVEESQQPWARQNLLEVTPFLNEVEADVPMKSLEPTDPLSPNPAVEDAWLSPLRFPGQTWDAR